VPGAGEHNHRVGRAGQPVGAGRAVDPILGGGLAVVVVGEQAHAGVVVGDPLQGRPDAVVALIAGLALVSGRHHPAQGVQDHQGWSVVFPLQPGGDRVDHAAVLQPEQVLELAGDRVAAQQLAAAVLEAAIAILQGEVQNRALGDGDAECLAAGSGGRAMVSTNQLLPAFGGATNSTDPSGIRPGTA
jgi:hypothetical protein